MVTVRVTPTTIIEGAVLCLVDAIGIFNVQTVNGVDFGDFIIFASFSRWLSTCNCGGNGRRVFKI